MIKYIGSKRTLVPNIVSLVEALPDIERVVDLFSGTSRVGHALKRAGYQVVSNDHNAYAATLARCYVQADLEDIEQDALALIEEFNRLPGRPGYFTHTFCEESRFFQPKNGARVDAIRMAIQDKNLPPDLEAVLLVSLMEAADRVDSTTGVQMAYLKKWAPRASNDLQMRLPAVLPRAPQGKGEAHQFDAFEAAKTLKGDLIYVDPPYNQHKYLGNYHIWETLVRWDSPDHYGVACKRVDCRERRSQFNSRPRFHAAFRELVRGLQSENLLVSFSNEGFLQRAELEAILGQHGVVTVIENDCKRYVGAQIGIYNPGGQKVGRVSHLRNKEFLFLVTPEPVLLGALTPQEITAQTA